MRWLPTSVRRPSVVLFRKLSKTGPHLLWNTITKLASLIQLSNLELHHQMLPWEDVLVYNIKYVRILKRFPGCLWRQTTAVINWADRRLSAGVVYCYTRSAMLGTCCSQSSSVVFTTLKSNRLLYAVRNSCYRR